MDPDRKEDNEIDFDTPTPAPVTFTPAELRFLEL